MAKQEDSSAYLKKAIKNHRYWVDSNADYIKNRSDKKIPQLLEQHDFSAVKVITSYLESLGLYYGTRGLVSVVDGQGGGWKDVDHAAMYQYWRVKLAIGAIFKAIHQGLTANPLYHEVPDAASLLCFSYVHDLKTIRDEFWDFWKRIIATSETTGGIGKYWGGVMAEGYYELFVCRMFANGPFGSKEPLPEYLQNASLGPYAAVLDSWRNPDAFANTQIGICDYHCQRMEQRSERRDPWPPFYSAPFDLVPYEILAIYKLRAEQGLETPEIDHPLLKLPTASRAQRKVTEIDDPLFPHLEKLYREQCLA